MQEVEVLSLLSRPVTWMKPLRLSSPSDWVGHIPFAYWLIEAATPGRLVELGTHSGNSYLSFLQCIDELKLDTQCFAVDTWQGDEHAGFYDDSVYQELATFHDQRYQSFSRLVRSTFDDALGHFEDKSIDILHIDGLHTYEAVKHDFESWRPKLSDRAIVLLHYINVREGSFGVWKFWEELKLIYPSFSFSHSHGLGVLLVGADVPARVQRFGKLIAVPDGHDSQLVQSYFGSLGEGQQQLTDVGLVLAETTQHLDAALKELAVYRSQPPAPSALEVETEAIREELVAVKLAAERWRDGAIDIYRNLVGQRLDRIAEGGLWSGAPKAVASGLEGRLQRIYSAGFHRLARYLLRLRHPGLPALRRQRYAEIVERDRGSAVLLDLFSGGTIDQERQASLFIAGYYLRKYPDVRDQEPHVHFATKGSFEDRQPHPLFDPAHYRMAAEALGESIGKNAFMHYLERGGRLRIDPHPLFFSGHYLDQLGEQGVLIRHPLVHYLMQGERAGLHPNPGFDPAWYLSHYPDVAGAGISALQHYVEYGQFEGRYTDAESFGLLEVNKASKLRSTQSLPLKVFRPREFAPTGPLYSVVPAGTVDVIIPVYGGVEETRRCVDRLLVSAPLNRALNNIILVDDCGPDPAMPVLLGTLQGIPRVRVVRNAQNLGFVESVNRGMEMCGRNDVVLLNSDTEVVGNWLDRLVAQGRASSDIGSVTPFSNNATICSYPVLPGRPDLPKGETVESLDDAFRLANAHRSVDLPTAVGFCMLIKRTCIDDTGLFDAKAFGRGYGEENDFCLRSAKLGWRHILAGDVFVFHVGEVSFSERSKDAKDHAWKVLTSRHPDYAASVARFVERDPVIPLRAAATAVLHRTSGLPVVLHLTHRLGGGTAKHVYSVANLDNGRIRSLVMEISAVGDRFNGRLVDTSRELDIEFWAEDVDELAEMLRGFGVSRIHIHHVFSFADHIEDLLRRLDLPYDLSIHDYMLVCPRINLVRPDGKYCEEPDEAGCLACLTTEPVSQQPDIIWWRLRGISLIGGAERVICPSQDTESRVLRYAPSANAIVVPHEAFSGQRDIRVTRLRNGEPLRIAAIGIMAGHKGGAFLVRCAERCRRAGAKVEITVIGYFDDPTLAELAANEGIRSTGAYNDDDLQQLIMQQDPHLLFYPQRWPETYSYTFSAGLISGRPLFAPLIGAFTERLAGQDWVWSYDIDASPDSVVKKLEEIRSRILAQGPINANSTGPDELSLNEFYSRVYESPESFAGVKASRD